MNTRVYFLSFSFGLGLGTTTMHTSNPFGEVMQLTAAGHHLEHVTIKSSSSDSAAAEQQQTEQGWQFLEWS